MCIITGLGPFYFVREAADVGRFSWASPTGIAGDHEGVPQDALTTIPTSLANTDLSQTTERTGTTSPENPSGKPDLYGFKFGAELDGSKKIAISTCCRLASQALRRYGLNNIEIDHALWDDLLTHHVSNFVRSRNRQRWDIDTPDSKDLDTSDLTDGDFETDFFVGFTVSGFLYGGLHLLAWNAPFHSTAEKWLWRSSAISLMSSGLYMGMMAWAISDSERSTTVLVLVLFIFCVAYGAARVYLVVECFTNLAYLPNSAYQMTSWSQYFPHIG